MVLSVFRSIVNDVFSIFSTLDVQFSVELFFCCSTVDCLHLQFMVSLSVFGNGTVMGITQFV